MRLFKEPLLHFLLIGAVLFALYAWMNPGSQNNEDQIVVDSGRIKLLQTNFRRVWNRPPSGEEMRGLIDDFVVEEILYRQALAMGLDRNDAVIRRRLRQKMEFITTDSMGFSQASDKELQQYLDEHPGQFVRDAVFSFEQIYIRTDRSADVLQARLEQIQQALANGEIPTGDSSFLAARFVDVSAFDVDRNFGVGFAESLDDLPLDSWSQPKSSGLGIHFVRLTMRQPEAIPPLAQIRGAVQREWAYAKNHEIKSDVLDNLKAGYEIVIDRDAVDSADRNI